MSFAQTMTQAGSGVRAFFGSQGGGYLASDPFVGTYVSGPGATGPYTVGSPLPGGVPTPYPPAPTPLLYGGSIPGYNFQGGGSSSGFNDLLPAATMTAAKSVIADTFLVSPTVPTDAMITIPYWNFHQATGASGWAWEQLDFTADYMIIGGTLAPTGAPSIPLFIGGNISAGGTPFVQFDGVVNYSFDSFANTAGAVTGAPSFLGSLNYTWSSSTSGPFSSTIFPTGSLAGTIGASGILELTGHFWVAGDPFDVIVSSDASAVPEPTTLGLLSVASMGLLFRRNRTAR